MIGAEAGVLAVVAMSVEAPARVQPGAEVGLGAFGSSRPAVPSSVPPICYEPRSAVPPDQSRPLAFRVKSRRALSVTRATDPTRKLPPHLEFITPRSNLGVWSWPPVGVVEDLGDGPYLNILRMFLRWLSS